MNDNLKDKQISPITSVQNIETEPGANLDNRVNFYTQTEGLDPSNLNFYARPRLYQDIPALEESRFIVQ